MQTFAYILIPIIYYSYGYFIDVLLIRFAQFFIEPLFNADSTDREMKAVDSGMTPV